MTRINGKVIDSVVEDSIMNSFFPGNDKVNTMISGIKSLGRDYDVRYVGTLDEHRYEITVDLDVLAKNGTRVNSRRVSGDISDTYFDMIFYLKQYKICM